ncbi:MAG: class I SAM-dependent methyltransferase [Hydrogenophaga sp.]|nr:class I SAM-dependent methyltransferase [Hydrogenophaga sp.]
MNGFTQSLESFIRQAAPETINEVGCGEGHWVIRGHALGYRVRGSDYSETAIDMARHNAARHHIDPGCFAVRSIEELDPSHEAADLVMCCEVLEHLEAPEAALRKLRQIPARHYILSVPREPLWCALNLVRGKYLGALGNTPGHLQHWSKSGFVRAVSAHFDVLAVASPLPWTMLLCRPKSDS